jgi:hypothetical protein
MHEHLMGIGSHLQSKKIVEKSGSEENICLDGKGVKALAQTHHVFFCHQAAAAHNQRQLKPASEAD